MEPPAEIVTSSMPATGEESENANINNNNKNNKQDSSSTFRQGTVLVMSAIDVSLTQLPERPGLAITCTVLVANIFFVAIMSFYSYFWACKQKLAMIDADWEDEKSETSIYFGGVNFDPYKDYFQDPSYICASFGRTNTTWPVFAAPCLLETLNCNQYGDRRCPDAFSKQEFASRTNYTSWCDPNLPLCNDVAFDSIISVTYMDCIDAFVAVGSALGYVAYVQMLVLAISYAIYHGCCETKKKDQKEQEHEVSAVAQATHEEVTLLVQPSSSATPGQVEVTTTSDNPLALRPVTEEEKELVAPVRVTRIVPAAGSD